MREEEGERLRGKREEKIGRKIENKIEKERDNRKGD